MSFKTLSFEIVYYQQKVTGVGTTYKLKDLFEISRLVNGMAEQGFKPRSSGSRDCTFKYDFTLPLVSDRKCNIQWRGQKQEKKIPGSSGS